MSLSVLGLLFVIAFLVWMPLSLIILWLIHKGQKKIMQETLVALATKVADNTRSLTRTSERLITLEDKHEARLPRSESDGE